MADRGLLYIYWPDQQRRMDFNLPSRLMKKCESTFSTIVNNPHLSKKAVDFRKATSVIEITLTQCADEIDY